MTKRQELYDTAIVGGGVTGLAAAMYAGRMKLKTILIGFPPGGVIATTDWIENYPGFISLSGKELADKITAHAKEYDIELMQDNVTDVNKENGVFSVHTAFGQYRSKTVIFSTGTHYRKLEVPGADIYEGKGVQFCGLCDGPMFQNKTLAVVGGGDSAAKEGLILTQWAQRIYIIVRGDRLKAEPINLERVNQSQKITLILNTNVTGIEGGERVEKVLLDKAFLGNKELAVQGVFIAIGSVPLSDLAKKLGVNTNPKGEIVINRQTETNIKGVFAAGDVTDTEFKQAITGVAEGVLAVYQAYKYIGGQAVSSCVDDEYLDCPMASENLRKQPE
ncbi:MAG: NAD(P)/FAD-dependent oxidoreductase [Candidatus Hermodarchaeota archaeon]